MMPLALVRSALTERMARPSNLNGRAISRFISAYRTLHVQEILRQEKEG
jgi:hypothetical protein